MLEIDRGVDDERPAPSAAEAGLARDAAKEVLRALPEERERLTKEIASAVGRADFESARSARDSLSLAEDRAAFAEGQMRRAELALLTAEGVQAERAAAQASEELVAAFAAEERARASHEEATALRCGKQAHMQSLQLRLERLRQQHEEAKRRIAQESA